jgi:hypothetical protein
MCPDHDTEVGRRAIRPVATGAPYAARAFGGSRFDLDLDLADADRPALVTRVLAACLSGFDSTPDAIWEWTVEERLQGLLAIAVATERTTSVETRCAARDCGASMQIDVDFSAFVTQPGHDPVVSSVDGATVVARLPRGVDQRRWRDTKGDVGSLATSLIESINGRSPDPGWCVPGEWIDALDAAFAERDPLTVLEFDAVCPACGHINNIAFDLEQRILQLLADEQRRLIDDVHALAAIYHWSEADIGAMPPWRRRAYLARIGREEWA